MKKYFPHISAFILTLILVFTVSGVLFPQTIQAQPEFVPPETGGSGWFLPARWIAGALGFVAIAVLKIASYLTYLSGAVLNFVVQYTVVDMKTHLDEAGAINRAWATIRDVANMGFIFILLYAAIQTILGIGSDAKKLIVNIIVVAILINFSLFFTKLVIDASNVLAITFYDAIAPEALSGNASIGGISNSLMKPLQIQSIWKVAKDFNGEQLLVIGVMGTLISLIAAFVFFAVAIMFVIRFVVLIFVLILSPIAFIAFVSPAPELKSKQKEWLDALLGQAFFAPIYFLLTWIVIVVASSLPTNPDSWVKIFVGTAATDGTFTAPATTDIGIVVNFIIIIALLITSLIIAKEWANKAGPGATALTKWAMGAAGGASFGLAARAGRYALGAPAEIFKESKLYKRLEAKSADKSAGGLAARLALATADKTRKSSFDVRGSRLGGVLAATGLETGQVGGQGGVEAERKKVEEFLETPGTESRRKRLERARGAQDELDVLAGARPGASPVDITAMEKALAKMSDREVEVIVDSNRELLESQAFANTISVRQLEALNKTDKLSETEKDALKARRFNSINTAMTPGGRGAATARTEIRALSDLELEMINPQYLIDDEFVAQLRSSQIENVNKSNKFTRAQKDILQTVRRQPLTNAIAAGNAAVAQDELQKLSPKEITALGIGIMSSPLVLEAYTPNTLKRMAQEMNTADIQTLRTALLTRGNIDTIKWLNNPDTGFIDFS